MSYLKNEIQSVNTFRCNSRLEFRTEISRILQRSACKQKGCKSSEKEKCARDAYLHFFQSSYAKFQFSRFLDS